MSEQKLEIFNVLNFLNSGYEINDILKQGNFGTFQSSEECINYLVENDYISSNNNILTAEEVSNKYTVVDLKKILKENGLKVSGNKQELVERVMPTFDKNFDDFELTSKAKEFLDENSWMDLYMFALVAFRFQDYETYVSNSSENDIQTALNFCDEVISRALIANQFLVFIDALSAKAHVYAYNKDYESFLDYDLQRFILGLNPIIMDSKTYSNYVIINEANIINLRNVIKHFGFGDLKKRFNKIWEKSNIRSITVPKNKSYKVLQKAISGTDIEELNVDLREKYFDKKFGLKI